MYVVVVVVVVVVPVNNRPFNSPLLFGLVLNCLGSFCHGVIVLVSVVVAAVVVVVVAVVVLAVVSDAQRDLSNSNKRGPITECKRGPMTQCI